MIRTIMNTNSRFSIYKNRAKILITSVLAILISLLGFIFSVNNSNYKFPLKLGLDFTGGTQIRFESKCIENKCKIINSNIIQDTIKDISLSDDFKNSSINLSNVNIQYLDDYKTVILRLPFLDSVKTKFIISSFEKNYDFFDLRKTSIDNIGPSLGKQLYKSSLISLLVAFLVISVYITFRFDRIFAFLALIALLHDIVIVCGIFSWLGLFFNIEVNSLFAVALLTISGYSVNDTVVIFDRIRELKNISDIPSYEKIDKAVNSTLTRTLYTSASTLLPLFSIVFLGGESLKIFAITLAAGIIIGSWSSIALAPALLTLTTRFKYVKNK